MERTLMQQGGEFWATGSNPPSSTLSDRASPHQRQRRKAEAE